MVITSYLGKSETKAPKDFFAACPRRGASFIERLSWKFLCVFCLAFLVVGCTNSKEPQYHVVGTYQPNSLDSLVPENLCIRKSYKPMVDSLRRLASDTSGTEEERFDDLGNRLIGDFNAVQNIDSLNEWITKPLVHSKYYFYILGKILENLPSVTIRDIEQFQTVDTSFNSKAEAAMVRHEKDVKEDYLVHLLWIANPEEEHRATIDLQKMTGLKLNTPIQWSNWWRSKYYN